jgi:hypothetical protein
VEFTNRDYQMIKTKNLLTHNKICFFFQNSTEKAYTWLTTEQTVNELNFKYYKVNTLAGRRVFSNSKHRLKKLLISGTTAIVKQHNVYLNYTKFTNEKIADTFILIAIKINNTIVSTEQFKSLNICYYTLMMLTIYNYLIANIKATSHFKSLSK